MKYEKLGSIFTITSGGTPLTSNREYYEKGNIPWVKTGDLKVKYLMEVPDSITKTGLENSSAKVFPPKTVLIAMYGATIGACSILKIAAATNQACGAILPNENVNEEYLYYYLSSVKQSFINKGVGGGQPNISATILKETKFPFIPISDQLHIANILSQAENLIVKRKESILLLDEFLKSTFLEMFGDPVGNEKGWEINSLGKFGSLKNGLNYTRNEKGVSVRCLGVGNFKDLSKLTDIESLTILNLSSVPSIDYFLKDGDLVFVRSNGNRELVGRCILVFPKAERVTFSGFCIRYRIEKAGIDSIFLSHLFRVPIFKKSMLQSGRGANIQNINQQILEGLKIPIPPLALQTKFAQIVESTEVIKAQYQSSLQELESLYGSLSQRAFKGELRAKDGEMMMAAETEPEYNRNSQ